MRYCLFKAHAATTASVSYYMHATAATELQQLPHTYLQRVRDKDSYIFVPRRPHTTTCLYYYCLFEARLLEIAVAALLQLLHACICTTASSYYYIFVLLYRLLHYDKVEDAADARLRCVEGHKDASDPQMHVTISFQEKVAHATAYE